MTVYSNIIWSWVKGIFHVPCARIVQSWGLEWTVLNLEKTKKNIFFSDPNKGRRKKTISCRHVRKQELMGGGQNPCSQLAKKIAFVFFLKEKKMQKVLKRKNMYFFNLIKNIFSEIYDFGLDLLICNSENVKKNYFLEESTKNRFLQYGG